MYKNSSVRKLGSKLIASLQPEKFIWKTMERKELRWLALAVALAFAAFGPIITLMPGDLSNFTWLSFIATTLGSAMLAGGIVLYGYKTRNIIVITFIFTASVLIPHQFTPSSSDEQNERIDASAQFAPGAQAKPEAPRHLIGIIGILCIAASYGVFLQVVSKGLQAKGALAAEISIARSIQESLLPKGTVQTDWCEIAGMTLPATEVGGDYFDIIQLDEQRILVAIGDVSGHGVGAGILSAMAKSALYSQLENHRSIDEAMEILNKTIFSVTDRKTFMTFCLLLLDHGKGIAKLASAGHPPVLYKAGDSTEIQELRTPNLGIGMRRETRFRHIEQRLEPGSSFFLYTDGIFEASNPDGDEFGEARLQNFFEAEQAPSAERFCQDAITAIRNFTASNSLQDDTTLIAVRITA